MVVSSSAMSAGLLEQLSIANSPSVLPPVAGESPKNAFIRIQAWRSSLGLSTHRDSERAGEDPVVYWQTAMTLSPFDLVWEQERPEGGFTMPPSGIPSSNLLFARVRNEIIFTFVPCFSGYEKY